MSTTAEERAITRVVDREDSPADWRVLERRAGPAPELWDDLLAALRDDAALRAAVRPALVVAEHCTAPAPVARPRLAMWSGWLAAALLLSLWWFSGTDPAPRQRGADNVVGELSRVLVEARPTPDGEHFEVIYMRRLLERAVVREVFELAADEHGLPAPARLDLAQLASSTQY